jgi:hypothetical protein
VSKRASLSNKGLDAVFSSKQEASKPASQKNGIPVSQEAVKPEKQHTGKKSTKRTSIPVAQKVKETYYIGEDVAMLLEDLRLRLRREHGLRPGEASKSRIVEAALRMQSMDLAALADALLAK